MALHQAPGLLLGLIGSGIQASRAPALHEGEAAEQGLRAMYKLIDIANDAVIGHFEDGRILILVDRYHGF